MKSDKQKEKLEKSTIMSNIQISVVMPALNEKLNVLDSLNDTLAAFDEAGISGEIILVNDGSTDETGQIAAGVSERDSRVSIITHQTPQGIGASFWEGVDSAQGEYVIMLPGDNENDPHEIFRYNKLLNDVDIIIPFVFNREKRSIFRNGLSFLYRFIINTTFLVNFNYTNGTILYRRTLLNELKVRNHGFFFQTDILIRLVRQGYLFAEVPYRLSQRGGGSSKALSFPSLMQVIKGYSRLVRDIHLRVSVESPYVEESQTKHRRIDSDSEARDTNE